ncbi:diguanylate cyclase/phosphodiesterase with PAS/PAC sensor(s) [Nitrosomonas sp. PY1]|uniref:EAL domain-containing protein n=1 Tax=Nitrosomonas sp. PY1 TaxID=1803906 RepID=UPI001FC84778|nr:EAL domain-containing protein [Nitrosomonas sp. PY1]GKS69834.1 diguanylate cyclase/phosphodiesterase with PAS/PAC sensor(s) [Nitrosomonas sp. PY1]
MKAEEKQSDLNHLDKNHLSDRSNHSNAVLAEQIKLLYFQTNKALAASLLISFAYAFILWDHISQPILLGWFSAICLLTFARFLLAATYFHKNPDNAASLQWGNYFLVGVGLSGILWGIAGGAFFVSDDMRNQLLLAYILGGMIAGAMAALSSYPGAFLLFTIPAIAPYTYRIFTHPNHDHIVIGTTVLLFAFLMWCISRRLYQTIIDSLNLRFENHDLINHLQQAHKLQNTVNSELQTQITEKNLTQHALQASKLELEQRILERTAELALSNDRLYREKELFQVTLASIGDAVITTDAMDRINYLNPIAEIYTGWNSDKVHGIPIQEIFRVKDIINQNVIGNPLFIDLSSTGTGKSKKNRECILTRRDKHEFIIDYSVAPIRDHQNQIIGSVLIFRDVTEQRKLTDKLTYQVTHDSLTGLLNRGEFEKRLRKILKSFRQYDVHALLFLDLDQFKTINDTCGHSAGDDLLRQVTALLNSKLRTRDTLARLGGDEFGVILEHCPEEEALQVANTLRELVQDFRFQWHDKTFSIGVSIGLYSINRANQALEDVLNAADNACMAAKNQGRNQVQIYREEDFTAQDNNEAQWLPRIQSAITNQNLCLYFQPIVAISHSSNLKEHGEILVRLYGEKNQLILPNSFLPVAERYHQMLEIDRWVIKESLELINIRLKQQSRGLYVINLSAHALNNENFLDYVVNHLNQQTFHASNICFEITENIALADLQRAVEFIGALKNLGCHFSMDDFGGNPSSFSYLKNIPIDYLKINGQLIRNLRNDTIDRAMIESINHIAHHMKLETIAEWVEDIQTLQLLEEIGIDYVQGFGLAKPYLFSSAAPQKQYIIH